MCLCAAALVAAALPVLADDPSGLYLTWSGATVPVEAQLSLHAANADWSSKKPLNELATIRHLHLAAGDYVLRFSAAGYKPVILTVKLRDGVRTNVEIPLRRFPRVTGTVMRGSSPLAGATIANDSGDLAKTDALGRFTLSVEHEWRPELRVNYPGLATRLVNVPAAEADVDVGTVSLSSGGTLIADVRLPADVDSGAADIVTADRGTVIVTHPIPHNAARVEFDALEAGEYRLVIRGPQPMQRMSELVSIKAGETNELNVLVHQRSLQLNVKNSAAKALSGDVYLKNMEGRWTANLEVTDSGLTTPLWQSGEFSVSVKAPGRETPYFTHTSISDDDSPKVTITLPDGRISGHVRDASGNPIAGSEVVLTTTTDNGATTRRGRSADDGSFAFDFVDAGRQSVHASAEGFVPATVNVDMPQSMELPAIDLQLRKGRQADVLVVDAQGTPLSDAFVIAATGGEVTGYYTSGPDGIAHASTDADRSATFFVIPRGGSFAIAHSTPAQSGATRVMVPAPAARLDLAVTDDHDEPVGPIEFLLRYDGEMLPLAVLTQLAMRTGVRFSTDAKGHLTVNALPPGVYEFMPYSSMQMASDLLDAGSSGNAVRVSLVPGSNTVTARFKRN